MYCGGTNSGNDIRPSLLVSNSIKNSEGGQCSLLLMSSPFKYPPLTTSASDGGNTGTTALIRSDAVMYTSPEGDLNDAKYSNTLKTYTQS